MICTPESATAVALVELLLTMLARSDMAERLAIAEAMLIVAHAFGADAGDCGAMLEAINGGEVERITALAEAVAGRIRATGPKAELRR